jgi:outer membrane protein TolC
MAQVSTGSQVVMRTEWWLKLATVALAVATSGCMSYATSDVRRVRSLAGAPALPDLAGAAGAATADSEARALLQRPLDASAAVKVALLNNRELRAQLRELGVLRGRAQQAGIIPNPTVEAEALGGKHAELELGIEYDVTDLVLAPLRSRVAEAEVDAGRYRVAAAVLQLGYDVRTRFYAVQAAQQRLGIAQRALDAFAASKDAAQALLDSGNVPAIDAASQIAAYERARVTVAEVELELANAREALQRLLGLNGTEGWSISGPLPAAARGTTVPDRLESRALQNSLELAEARSQLEAIARRTGLTRTSGWLPDVSLGFKSVYEQAEAPAGEPWRFGGGVTMTIPLFDRQQGTLSAQEAEFDARLERYRGFALELRSAVRDARNRLLSARARALHFEDVILPAQRSVTEQTLLQYNAMQIGVFELLQARRAELEAELSYALTLREYWTAAAALEAFVKGRRVTAAGQSGTASLIAIDDAGGGH